MTQTQTKTRTITYAKAINEGLRQSMRASDEVFVMGQVIDNASGIFHTTSGTKIPIYSCNMVIRIVAIKFTIPIAGIM